MDIKKEAEKLAKNVNKDDLKKAVSQALDSKRLTRSLIRLTRK